MKGVGLLDGGSHGTAAEDDVAVVDYNGLAGGDGALRLVKVHPRPAVRQPARV